MNVGTLFNQEPEPEQETRQDQIIKQFAEFHKANPMVWKLFQRFTFDVIAKGFEHYSASAVVHRIRWEADIEIGGNDVEFKINNNFIPYFARMFHLKFPKHIGFFRNREQISANQPAADGEVISRQPDERTATDRVSARLMKLLMGGE